MGNEVAYFLVLEPITTHLSYVIVIQLSLKIALSQFSEFYKNKNGRRSTTLIDF